jgi:hypothetical protein
VLIAKRPGIRAVEIADQVDCEIEAVEWSIQDELSAGRIRREIIMAPNGRPTSAFWLGEQPVAAEPAPVVIEPKVQITPPASPASVPAPAAAASTPAIPAASPPPLVAPPTKTKVELAMEFVRGQTSRTATDDELRAVMGLAKDRHPASFLSTQLKRGYLIKRDGLWHLREGRQEEAQPQPPAPERPVSAEFRCALWSDGELQLARGEQTAMRLTAVEVGQLREYLAGSRAAA